MYQSIKEHFPVPLREEQCLLAGQRLARGFAKHAQAEIGQTPAFELGCPFHHLFRSIIHAKTQTRSANAAFRTNPGA
jgi:hypothetical protein